MTCSLTSDFGVVVQLILGIMVLLVLFTEYALEFVKEKLSNDASVRKPRSFHTFWFDTYKIVSGAMVSHCFNVLVSLTIEATTNGGDECALYCLAFYYEVCGVPFVQLLQYSVTEYARRMSRIGLPPGSEATATQRRLSKDRLADPKSDFGLKLEAAQNGAGISGLRQRPNPPQRVDNSVMSEVCRERWLWISEPGVYSPLSEKYPVAECLRCEDLCGDSSRLYLNLFLIAIFAAAISIVATAIAWAFTPQVYLAMAVPISVFIFVTTSWLAPNESRWQTIAWVSLKTFEKSLWSVFAVSQAKMFAVWSKHMKLSKDHLDAFIYIAAVPIIMNAFMFFMFSRISRLQLPCVPIRYNKKLNKLQQESDETNAESEGIRDLHLAESTVAGSYQWQAVDSQIAGRSTAEDIPLTGAMQERDPTDTFLLAAMRRRGDGGDTHSECDESGTASIVSKAFDRREAFKVGIASMLVINSVLYGIATALLVYKGAGVGVLFLGVTMLVIPLICSALMILIFGHFIDNSVVLCHCCAFCLD